MSGYVAPNWPPPNPLRDGYAPVIIYGYLPSSTVSIVASILFTISLLLHTTQIIRHKTIYFVTIPIALALEIIGYIFRTFSALKNPYFVLYFILQYFCIVTAPVFISAGIYAVLSVLINRVGREYSPLMSPRSILIVFITSDVVCTAVQICGAALIGVAKSNGKDATMANNILLAGLAVQVLVFFVFLCLLGLFLKKAWKVVFHVGRHMTAFLAAFVAATLLVYLRTCFRLCETATGLGSHLSTTEGYFVGLEFVPIVLAVCLFNVWHPGRCLRKNDGFTGSV